MDRSIGQKFNKEIRELTDALTQMDLTDIYGTFRQIQKDIPSSKHLMEPSLKLTIYSVKTSTDTKK